MALNTKKSFQFGYGAYQHVASVFGAFGILIFVQHFVPTDWHQLINLAIEFWTDKVRPAFHWLAEITVLAALKALFDIHIKIPDAVADYICCGIILVASSARSEYFKYSHYFIKAKYAIKRINLTYLLQFGNIIFWFMLLWPFIEILFLLTLFVKEADKPEYVDPSIDTRKMSIYIILPILYLGAIYVLNWGLEKFHI